MATRKRKAPYNKKIVATEVAVETQVTALAAVALFLATIPLAIMIALWSVLMGMVFVRANF